MEWKPKRSIESHCEWDKGCFVAWLLSGQSVVGLLRKSKELSIGIILSLGLPQASTKTEDIKSVHITEERIPQSLRLLQVDNKMYQEIHTFLDYIQSIPTFVWDGIEFFAMKHVMGTKNLSALRCSIFVKLNDYLIDPFIRHTIFYYSNYAVWWTNKIRHFSDEYHTQELF